VFVDSLNLRAKGGTTMVDNNGDINDESRVEDDIKAGDIVKNDESSKTEDDSLVAEFVKINDDPDDSKQALRSLLEVEVKHVMDEEIKKAKQELITEQRKAIIQILEENKKIIRELVEEEKTAIWDKVAELRKSLLLHFSEELNNHNM
jgi:hypothetical protein